MKYLGIFSGSECKHRYKNAVRFTKHYSHSTVRHSKNVDWFEVIEDTSPQPVKINRANIRQFHLFFTQTQAI